jgi:S1-C subfamily serine protease
MSTYDPYPPRSRRGPSLWPLGLLLVLTAVLVWVYLHREQVPDKVPHDVDASPRPVAVRGELENDEQRTIRIYKDASPSVVHITNLTERRDFFNLNGQQVPKGTGTGFVWNDEGIIVTNFHVVRDASVMRVVMADKERTSYETRSWISYPDKDLAVLYIQAPKSKLRPLRIGTSHDLQIGQKTYAIGNPFGLDQTLTTGIVSALGREIESANGRPIQGVIQTSAAINPGNSGGPLLDSDGRLVGVNTAILSPSGTFAGIGFAIPVDEVNRVVPQLVAALNKKSGNQEMTPPRLGIQPAEDNLAQELGVNDGVLVIRVQPGSPAARAGLRPTRQDPRTGRIRLGDVIVAIDGKPIANLKDLYSQLEQHQLGDQVTLTILRGDDRVDVKVTLDPFQV